jgi:hypothetical protein
MESESIENYISQILPFLDKHPEGEYLNIKTPLNEKQGYFVGLVWNHHDGEIEDHSITNPNLHIALADMLNYLQEREAYFNRPIDYSLDKYDNFST